MYVRLSISVKRESVVQPFSHSRYNPECQRHAIRISSYLETRLPCPAPRSRPAAAAAVGTAAAAAAAADVVGVETRP